MLVLSRKVQQEINFPDQSIRIRVLGVKGNRVQIGIEAPDDVKVLRAEISDTRCENYGITYRRCVLDQKGVGERAKRAVARIG